MDPLWNMRQSFLIAVAESAQDAIITINELDKLHKENYNKMDILKKGT